MPNKQIEIEPKQQLTRQEAEQNYSVTDSLIERSELGMLNVPDAPSKDEQAPYWQKQRKKDKKKRRGIGM